MNKEYTQSAQHPVQRQRKSPPTTWRPTVTYIYSPPKAATTTTDVNRALSNSYKETWANDFPEEGSQEESYFNAALVASMREHEAKQRKQFLFDKWELLSDMEKDELARLEEQEKEELARQLEQRRQFLLKNLDKLTERERDALSA